MHEILIVEDDTDIRELVIYALKAAGFSCAGFEDGAEFFSALSRAQRAPSLILLDIMLPGDDGLSILKRLRANPDHTKIPVVMLTAKGSEADKVRGLDLGADDYVTKPFGVTELVARIRAILRRVATDGEGKGPARIVHGNIALDRERRTVTVDGHEVPLTFREFELLDYLLVNTGIVLSRDRLMDAVWGYDYAGESRTVDMHVRTLRRKLGPAGERIKTVRNVGYKIGD